MSVQKTFTIVPTASRDASPVTAFAGGRMTSKQVKQAYKTANKGPRLSRAEQLKADRAEQQRIRKEMEKDKAAAKARLLRDKKKEKELAEKEIKRKEGKPLVNVRPSQDTIARFVRGDGGRKQDCVAAERRTTQAAQSHVPAKPEQVLHAIAEEQQTDNHRTCVGEVGSNGTIQADKTDVQFLLETKDQTQTEARICRNGENREDESMSRAAGADDVLDCIPSELLHDFELSPQPSASKAEAPPPHDDILAAVLDEDLDTDLSQDATKALSTTTQVPEHLPEVGASQLDALLDDDLDIDELDHLTRVQEPVNQCKTTYLAGDASALSTGSVSPPNLVKQQASEEPAGLRKPQISQGPPVNTQSIMLNVADFFPTASQQALELDEETDYGSFLGSLTPRQVMPPPATPTHLPSRRSSDTSRTSQRLAGSVDAQQSKQAPSPSPRPQQWFTASGSRERVSLAMQRSRRSAALEEIQKRERLRASVWGDDCFDVSAASQEASHRVAEPPAKRPRLAEDKENVAPDASQETDYGGGWVDDLDFDV